MIITGFRERNENEGGSEEDTKSRMTVVWMDKVEWNVTFLLYDNVYGRP